MKTGDNAEDNATEKVGIVGTSLTPEFWRQFTVLLVIFTAATIVLGAALDTLVLRARKRSLTRRRATAEGTTKASRRPGRRLVRH